MKSSIEKARYHYRLFAILQWVVAAIVTEAVLGVLLSDCYKL
jgi:hypothetical protein